MNFYANQLNNAVKKSLEEKPNQANIQSDIFTNGINAAVKKTSEVKESVNNTFMFTTNKPKEVSETPNTNFIINTKPMVTVPSDQINK